MGLTHVPPMGRTHVPPTHKGRTHVPTHNTIWGETAVRLPYRSSNEILQSIQPAARDLKSASSNTLNGAVNGAVSAVNGAVNGAVKVPVNGATHAWCGKRCHPRIALFTRILVMESVGQLTTPEVSVALSGLLYGTE